MLPDSVDYWSALCTIITWERIWMYQVCGRSLTHNFQPGLQEEQVSVFCSSSLQQLFPGVKITEHVEILMTEGKETGNLELLAKSVVLYDNVDQIMYSTYAFFFLAVKVTSSQTRKNFKQQDTRNGKKNGQAASKALAQKN